jgi:DNA polymerase
MRARGVRFLNVQTETLEELRRPPAERSFVAEPIVEARPAPASRPAPALESVAAKSAELIDGNLQPAENPVPSVATAESTPLESAIPGGDPALGNPPVINGKVDKGEAIEQLRSRALVCLKCPHLVRSRKNVVFGVGDIHSPLMFVGEAPGAEEDQQGEPFVGAAGQLLTRIIQTMGFSRETVYIANILKCRPDTPGQSYGNRKPTPEEMRTCLPYLLAQIDLIAPKVIVALGVTAVEGLFGKCEGIHRLRGNFQVLRDIPLMPTYHPAYLLRTQALSDKRKVWEDMLQVLEKLERPVTEKQRGYFLKA